MSTGTVVNIGFDGLVCSYKSTNSLQEFYVRTATIMSI